jgi:hypothetical protein
MKHPGPLLAVFSSTLLASACPQGGGQSAPETSSSSTSSTSADPPTIAPTTGATTSATTGSASTTSTSSPLDTGSSPSTTDESGENDAGENDGSSSSGTTTGGPLQNCGDGELDPDEECDLGVDNDDHGACTVECKAATCGDKLTWEGHEECDNGPNNNDNLYGGCTTQCQFGPRCNDGIVQDTEECDLGENNGSTEFPAESVPCDDGCRFVARLAFLSSQTYQAGDLKGVEGADIKCQTLAGDAKFDSANKFKAWLSDSQHSPEQNFTKDVDLPIVRIDGVRIADNWDDLILNGPAEGIVVTDKGEPLLGKYVWTGTTPSGKLFDDALTCKAWSSSSPLDNGWRGLSGVDKLQETDWETWVEERQWTNHSPYACNWKLRLYCIEQ